MIQRGRIVLLEDASGFQTFFYGKMGEVTENIHTFALPNESQPYTFKMKYRYDSWKICASRMNRKLVFCSEAQPNLRVANRVQSITYPDGEVVSYWYDRGGMLRNMEGQKGTQTFKYIDKIYYNRYGLKDAQWYGNGTEVKYSYDTLLRLSLLESSGALGVMQHVTYDYDKAGNITGIQNSAPISSNGLGGTYAMTYAYDSLYRLQSSTGGLNGRKNYSYWLDMAYDANGRILRKSQLTRVFTSTSSDTLMNYAHLYNYGTAPVNNRVQSVADTMGAGPAQTFTWDANGNMLSHASSIGVRTHCWDELNRLQGSADKKHNACYLYDVGGDRFYKFSGTPDIMYVNGQWHTYLTFSDPTLYASPYLVATNKGYTKHYYAESERVASKIGGGGLQNLHAVCDELYTDNTSAGSAHVLPRPYAELPELDFEAKRDSSKMHLKRLADCVEGEMGEIKENILMVLNQYAAGAQASPHSEDECYWYHPDHLGSASWVSDKAGKGIQHLYYLPWGEELDNQRATDYASRYTFSGKERDMETGYGYFGARYYNSDLSIWLSVDPLADKYPGLSPYTYCANNPVKLVDPDGRTWETPEDAEKANRMRRQAEDGIMVREVVLSLFLQICFLLAFGQTNFPVVTCEESFPAVFTEQTAQQIKMGLDITSYGWPPTSYGCSSCDTALIVTYKIDAQIILGKDSLLVLQVTNISYDSPLKKNGTNLDTLFYILDDDPLFYIEHTLKSSHFCYCEDDAHLLQTDNLIFMIPLYFVPIEPDIDISQIKRRKCIRRGNHGPRNPHHPKK